LCTTREEEEEEEGEGDEESRGETRPVMEDQWETHR
jgi:hypothetical protein